MGLSISAVACTEKVGGDFVTDPPEVGGSGSGNPIYDAGTYREKAHAVFQHIVTHYGVPGTDLFLEQYPAQAGDNPVAYFWSHSTLYTGAVLLQSLGYQDESIRRVLDGIEVYWDAARSPVGFQSYPRAYGGGDRFYDDNAIAGIDDMLAYEVTGDVKYLDRAEAALRFTMSGESDDQGGGLFWCEQNRMNDPASPNTVKATNSSALAVELALGVYRERENAEYLDFAQRVYQWIKSRMQDPADGTYWNDVHAHTGVVNERKWTYNSGAMITNAILFYEVLGDPAYLESAKADAAASYAYFTVEVPGLGRFFPDHDPWFTAVLFRGYLDVYRHDPNPAYIHTLIANVDHAWKSARTANGFFLEDWAGRVRGRERWLINQTCMVEIYARIAQFKGEVANEN